MASRPVWTLSPLLLLLLLPPPPGVLSQDLFDLADALDIKPTTPAPRPPAGGAGGAELDFEGSSKVSTTTTTKAPPKISTGTTAPVKPKPKPKPKPAGDEFNLADALDPQNDIGGQDRKQDQVETTAEVGTIAGIVSAVAMALVGAISSYISYQKKKLCFSLQQSLNTDMVKAENPEAVVATEPQAQVQQTLLEPHNTEAPTEDNAV